MSEPAESTLVGHMCYQFANDVECMSQVRVNPETGEFDASQAFKDMLDFTEGESDQPQSESLMIGKHRLAVERAVDRSFNHSSAMLLRAVDLVAFKEVVAEVHAGFQTILEQSTPVQVVQSGASERPAQRPRP